MTIVFDGDKGEVFPTWTTATRPTNPSTGQTGYNTTTNQLEVYNATYTNWQNVGTSGINYSVSYLIVAGGGGGSGGGGSGTGGAGGSGVVILSIPTANYTGTVTGSPTVTTSGSNTIVRWTTSGSGTYTA